MNRGRSDLPKTKALVVIPSNTNKLTCSTQFNGLLK